MYQTTPQAQWQTEIVCFLLTDPRDSSSGSASSSGLTAGSSRLWVGFRSASCVSVFSLDQKQVGGCCLNGKWMTGAPEPSQTINGFKVSTCFTSIHVVLSEQEMWPRPESWYGEGHFKLSVGGYRSTYFSTNIPVYHKVLGNKFV